MGLSIKPAFRLHANKQDITNIIQQRFISLSMTDEAGVQSDTLQVTLSDHDPSARIAIPSTGAELELSLGYDNLSSMMGLFVVDEVELSGPPDRMVLKAKAAPQQESPSGKTQIQTQKTRSWENVTIGQMAVTIASNHGLAPAVANSLVDIVLPHIDQVNESDMSLLTRIVNNYGAIAKPAGGKLVVAKTSESRSISGTALPDIALTPLDVSSWRTSLTTRNQSGTVIAVWRDMESAADQEVTFGAGEPVRRLRFPYTSPTEAQSAAKAEHEKHQRDSQQLSITLPGNPSLISEGTLNLSGFRAGVNGRWLITRVEHRLASDGYVSSVNAELSG